MDEQKGVTMNEFLKENYDLEFLTPVQLKDSQSVKWALGTIFGNNASKTGLASDGAKPEYYLYKDLEVIRITPTTHQIYQVKKIDDKLITVAEIKDKFIIK